MNYKEKYNAALERMRSWVRGEHPECFSEAQKAAEFIFPEFKESEEEINERVRVGLIKAFNTIGKLKWGGLNVQDVLAWLEKQGQVKESIYSQHEIEMCKENDDSLTSENERIKREILELVSIAGNGNQFEEIKDWLEKQNPNTHKKEIDDAYLQGICDAKHAIEKQGESTITNIEIPFGASDSELQEVSYDIPKGFYAEIKDNRVVIKKTTFKVGNWVVKNGIVAKILDKQKYGFVGLDIDGKDFFCNYGHTDSMRLWNISDAKDGDILVNGSNIFIFHFLKDGRRLMGYCHVNMDNELFLYDDVGKSECFCTIDAIVTPATKEQRDLLFQKMKEAGYKWDAEKKELKKIEVKSENIDPKPLDANKVIKWLNDQACLGWIEDVEVDKFVKKFKKDFNL